MLRPFARGLTDLKSILWRKSSRPKTWQDSYNWLVRTLKNNSKSSQTLPVINLNIVYANVVLYNIIIWNKVAKSTYIWDSGVSNDIFLPIKSLLFPTSWSHTVNSKLFLANSWCEISYTNSCCQIQCSETKRVNTSPLLELLTVIKVSQEWLGKQWKNKFQFATLENWSYTGRIVTTIFSTTQGSNVGTILQPFETM